MATCETALTRQHPQERKKTIVLSLLRLAAFFPGRQRTGMPLLILNVNIAEPPTASRTANRGGMRAWLVVTRYGLTEML